MTISATTIPNNARTEAQQQARQARAELAKRELARRHLADFERYMKPDWRLAGLHELLCAELEQVARFIETKGAEGTGFLMIEMPPQHTKTTHAAQLLPAWVLGKLPWARVILTAYSADLATTSSRKVREYVNDERYSNLFGERSALEEVVEIDPESRSVTSWNLRGQDGGVVAYGVGGQITGRPADLIVIDDPVKNRQEADNAEQRKKILDWYSSSILSRRRKGTAMVIMHTRWHRQDLSGMLMRAMVNDARAHQFKIICLPAVAYAPEEYAQDEAEQRNTMREGVFKPLRDALGRAPGEPLWPAEFPLEMLESTRASLEANGNGGDWHALYQQQPRPQEGEFFAANDFKVIKREALPDGLRWSRYVDLAVSAKRKADYNTTGAMALDGEGNVYLRDVWRVKAWEVFRHQLKSLMLSDDEGGVTWHVESNGMQEVCFQELMREPELIGTAIFSVKVADDKVSRARPLQGRAKAGKLYLVEGNWVETFINEAVDFPTGVHDDLVDMASGGLQMLATPRTTRMGHRAA